MPLTPYMKKNVLDWVLGGAAAVQPTQRWVQWATGIPNDAGASDGAVNSRESLDMAAAQSGGAAASATNRSARSNGTVTAAAQSVRGFNIYDSTVGGTRLIYGTCTVGFSATSGSGIALSAGRLTISIS